LNDPIILKKTFQFLTYCIIKKGLKQYLQKPKRSIYFPPTFTGISDMRLNILSIRRVNMSGEGDTQMTDNLKVKVNKIVDTTRVQSHAAYDNATVTAHNLQNNADEKAHQISDDVKIGISNTISDVKITTHELRSKLKTN